MGVHSSFEDVNEDMIRAGIGPISAGTIIAAYRQALQSLMIYEGCRDENWARDNIMAIVKHANDDDDCRAVFQEWVPEIFATTIEERYGATPRYLLEHTRPYPELRAQLPEAYLFQYLTYLVEAGFNVKPIVMQEPVLEKAVAKNPNLLLRFDDPARQASIRKPGPR